MTTLPDHELEPIDPDYKPAKTFTQLLQEGHPEKGGLSQLASAEQMESPQSSTEAPAGSLNLETSEATPSVMQRVIQAVASVFGSPQTETKPDDTAM